MSKFRKAIGLAYAGGENAPTVSARGEFALADEIVAIARRYGVPVVERSDLAELLDVVDLDEEIPIHLYEAVAIVLQRLASRSQD